jgi:hypothetical protein
MTATAEALWRIVATNEAATVRNSFGVVTRMRTFWIAILLLAAAVAVIAWMSRAEDSRRASTVALNNTDATTGSAPPANQAIAVPTQRDGKAAMAEASPQTTAGALRAPTTTPVAAPGSETSNTSDAGALADDLMQSADETQDDDLAEALDDGSVPAPGNHDESEVSGEEGDAAPATIDGKYILSGDGSPEQPFEITWDLLILASQTYQPRQGKTDLPPQVQAMNGMHIKIAGYFAIPIASTDPKEVLFMLNMWDGCCIGVPPSPYDAIEVRLREPLSGKKQFVNYGTLTGTLKVDPYVQNGWLLGMYLMEDGTLDIGL